jgi:hypothetical protein
MINKVYIIPGPTNKNKPKNILMAELSIAELPNTSVINPSDNIIAEQ